VSVTLPATIAEQLRERIIEGEFAPGARLNERTLCDRLGVSRTPLREAFRMSWRCQKRTSGKVSS
jgi:DNA-binding GntR family transcriptional regulator